MIKTETILSILDRGLAPPEGEYENPGVKVLCDSIRDYLKQIDILTNGILIMAEVEENR